MRRLIGLLLIAVPLALVLVWVTRNSDWLEVLRLVAAVFFAGAFTGSVLVGIALLLPDDE